MPGVCCPVAHSAFKLQAERISLIEDPGKKAALAMMLSERAGTNLLPMMARGAAGLEEMQQQARQLGLTISSLRLQHCDGELQSAREAAIMTDKRCVRG